MTYRIKTGKLNGEFETINANLLYKIISEDTKLLKSSSFETKEDRKLSLQNFTYNLINTVEEHTKDIYGLNFKDEKLNPYVKSNIREIREFTVGMETKEFLTI